MSKYEKVKINDLTDVNKLKESEFYQIYRNYYYLTTNNEIILYNKRPFGNKNKQLVDRFSKTPLLPYEDIEITFIEGPVFVGIYINDWKAY